MDLLSQYENEHPEVLQKKTENQALGAPFFIRVLAWVSGGRIREVRQVEIPLFVVSIGCIALAAIIVFRWSSVPVQPPPGFEGNIPRTPEYGFYETQSP